MEIRFSKRLSLYFRLSIICFLATVAALVQPVFANIDPVFYEAAKSLPDQVGEFRGQGAAKPLPFAGFDPFENQEAQDCGAISQAFRDYASLAWRAVYVDIIRTQTDSGAFALLTKKRSGSDQIRPGLIGTAGIVREGGGIIFFKGRNLVRITTRGKATATSEELLVFARAFAGTLDASEDDIPVLVKHLPNWQTAQPWAHYAVSSNSLKQDVPNQPIINEVSFEGGTEAVAAYYGPSYLVIVEFTTPQLAGDNDRRITPRIQELRDTGQPVPSAYRRVGNYSVFVFNAPDEKTATQLIDQVKYEQVVQWLGDDPYWWEKAQRIYLRTTGGVLIAVLQSSGISFLVCLTIGGIIGAVLFKRRRTRQAATGYSDAGGMVRLNIDELTEETNRRKLLGGGEP